MTTDLRPRASRTKYFYEGIELPLPPITINSGSHKILVSGSIWIRVPRNFVMEHITVIHYVPPKEYPFKKTVTSDTTDEEYDVTLVDEKYGTCTCLGYMYRRYCKHLTALREELKHLCSL